MKKKTIILIIIILLEVLTLQAMMSKPQRVLLVGKVIGFEVDGEYEKIGTGEMVATSTQKIGTVTFMKEDTYEFVALGHSTLRSDTSNKGKSHIKGTCYNIKLEGINKGSEEEVGGIVASLKTNNEIGNIYYDSSYGIFGEMNSIDEDYKEVETECWYNVKRGKANILIDLDGTGLKSYEIEITGINYINGNKNIKIKVTDKDLIEKAGGIVQGMSGTPVMQNRKTYWSNKLRCSGKSNSSICNIYRQTSLKYINIICPCKKYKNMVNLLHLYKEKGKKYDRYKINQREP